MLGTFVKPATIDDGTNSPYAKERHPKSTPKSKDSANGISTPTPVPKLIGNEKSTSGN
jgi:hypothetical protein